MDTIEIEYHSCLDCSRPLTQKLVRWHHNMYGTFVFCGNCYELYFDECMDSIEEYLDDAYRLGEVSNG